MRRRTARIPVILCVGLVVAGLALPPAGSAQEVAAEAADLPAARRSLVAGRYADAERQARAALASLEGNGRARSVEAAEWLDVLVTAMWRGGKASDDGVPALAAQAIDIKESLLGPDDPALATSLDNAGVLFFLRGEYELALPLYERARGIWESASAAAPRHKGDLGKVHSHLGPLFQELGQYSSARNHYERALSLFRETLGPDHMQVAMTENNLATLLARIGDYGDASELYRRSLATLENRVGPEHPLIANSKHNIAELEQRMGRLEEAIGHYREAASLKEKVLGTAHPSLALTLGNLSYLYSDRGDLDAAEELAGRAVRIQEGAYGVDHVELAYGLVSLGRAQAGRGDFDAARATLERAVELRVETLGPDNPLLVQPLHFLSETLLSAGERQEAFELALRAETIGRNHLRLTARGAPERQALRYAAERLSGLDLALAVAAGARDPATVAAAWDALIRSRAVVLDETAARRRLITRRGGPDVDAVLSTYRTATERLVNVLLRGPGASEDAADYRGRVAGLRAAAEAAERAVAAASGTLRRGLADQDMGFADIRQALPDSTALVAFARIGREPRAGSAAYLAFVLESADASPRIVSLGAAGGIEAAIRDWRDGLRPEAPGDPRAAYGPAGERLRQLLWEPLELDLAADRLVLIVPAGALHLVNFSALPTDAGGFLAEADILIHYLSSERDLAGKPARVMSPELLVMAGGGPQTLPSSRDPDGAPASCNWLARTSTPPLPGARREARRVASIWDAQRDGQPAVGLFGEAATKAAFLREAPGKTIVHVATHGFFAANDCLAGTADAASPLRLSGLVFPASEDPQGGTVLLAEEVAAMDLGAAEWVVLSGCDTGVGPVQVDEGILGLRRALRVAGAGTLVMSLWPVEDRSAETFMTALYEARLDGGLSTPAAMRAGYRAAIAAARRERGEAHPLYWAPFIASGDWR